MEELSLLKQKYIPFDKKIGNRFKDLSGKHIGMTTFLYRMENDTINKPKYVCRCDCGAIFTIHKSFSDCYRNGKEVNINCGCKGSQSRIGERVGNFIILERITNESLKKANKKRMYFKCRCDCGEEEILSTYDLSHRTQCIKCLRKIQSDLYTINEIGNQYGDLTVIKKAEGKYESAHWVCKCSCGNEIIVRGSHLRDGTSKSCGCKGLSYNEYKITQILSSLNIQYTIQKKFKELGELRFDIYVDNNYMIEYDGEQHFLSNHRGNLEEIHNHDLVKNQFCFSHNIPIIRIPYTEQLTYTSKDLMLETTRFLLTPENESLYYKKLMENEKSQI